jgi:hypothetical protein
MPVDESDLPDAAPIEGSVPEPEIRVAD